MKFTKGSEGAVLNLSPSSFEKYNQMVVIEGTANWHINFDGQVNEQNKRWLLYESGRCN